MYALMEEMFMMKFINWLFRMEEINGRDRCPTYMYRWTLFRLGKYMSCYLHHFVGDDWSRDMHDHPKRFVSIGLWGQYTEETPAGERIYRAPWIRTFPANHVHRIRLHSGTCWTFVIVFKAVREWGFVTPGGWMHWRRYVGSSAADAAKTCG